MNCWICGAPADSGEHRVKASDLKMLFPDVTQKFPIYTKDASGRVLSIGGLKSDKLKWDAKLCHKCNTTRTQRYDRAWQTLSEYLQQEASNPREKIKLTKVFPGSVNSSMLDVHLFFVKVFGCLIAEHSIPTDLASFSNALLSRIAHPHVYLGFGILPSWTQNKAFITPVNAMNVGGTVEFAFWYYMVRKVFVDAVYSLPQYLAIATDTWHPSTNARILKLSRLRSNHQLRRELAQRNQSHAVGRN